MNDSVTISNESTYKYISQSLNNYLIFQRFQDNEASML